MQNIHISIISITSKKKKDGSNPLALRIHFGGSGKRKMYSLYNYGTGLQKLSATKANWDSGNSRFKEKADPRNKTLFDLERKIADYQDEVKFKGVTFTIDGLERRLFNQVDLSSCFALFDVHIKNLDSEARFAYAITFRNSLSAIKRYTKQRDLPLSEVTTEWVEDFDKYLKATCTVNTRSIYLRSIRTIFNSAIKKSIVSRDLYPFGINGFKIKAGPAKKRALTQQQVLALINKKVPKELSDSQNYFALSYLGGGVNFKDMALWRWDQNVENKRIVYIRSKTRNKDNVTPQSIALNGRIAEILAEYTRVDEYILPIVFSKNQKTIRHQILNALKRTNKDIKRIARMAKVPNPDQITFYTARHSFATILKKKGHSVELISELLGHSDIKTTQIYLGSFDDATKDAAFEDLL